MDQGEELLKESLKELITKIDIEDGGIVTIASHDGAAAEEAQKIIEGLTRKVHEGEIFSGVVTRIIPIGAFVEILPGKEGMVHISQLILGDTGCVSYIVNCKEKRECAIVDSFEGFEEDIHEELKRLGFPTVKYVIDTHTHADRRSASGYFAGENGLDGVVKSEITKYKGKKISTKDGDILKIGNAELEVLYTPGHTYDHNCYLVEGNLLSGDCLVHRRCR